MRHGDGAILAQRRAIETLAVWSYGDGVYDAVRRAAPDALVPPAEAFAILAGAIAADDRHLPRLIVLDLLVRIAARRGLPDPGDDTTDPFAALLEALGRQAEGVTAGDLAVGFADLGPVARQIAAQLRQISPGLSTMRAWDGFATALGPPLHLTSAEANNPPCDDRRFAVRAAGRAPVIQSEFYSDQSVAELRAWADPRVWPKCSHFFTGMDQVGPHADVPGGWDDTFVEHVDMLGKPLATPLAFQYRERPDGTRVRTTYRLVAPTADIAVDDGYLCIEHDPMVQSGPATKVSAVKVILFQHEPLASCPTIACDTYWGELLKSMVTSCGALGYPPGP